MKTIDALDFISSKVEQMKKEYSMPNTADGFQEIAQTANELYNLLVWQVSGRYRDNVRREQKLKELARAIIEVLDPENDDFF